MERSACPGLREATFEQAPTGGSLGSVARGRSPLLDRRRVWVPAEATCQRHRWAAEEPIDVEVSGGAHPGVFAQKPGSRVEAPASSSSGRLAPARRMGPPRLLRAVPLTCGLVALLAAGCSSPRELVERLDVRAESLREDTVLGQSPEAVRATLSAAVEAAPLFKLLDAKASAPEGKVPWRFQLELHRDEKAEAGLQRVAALLQLRRKPEGLVYEVEALAEVKGEAGVEGAQVAARAAAKQAIALAVDKAAALLKAAARKDDALVPELDSPSSPVREAAIAVLAERGNRAVGPALAKQLEVRDANVQRKALGLLIALKDPATVSALIEASRARDPIFQREVVFAIAAIGGEEAEAYLFTMASGSDHPVLKASAEQALAELKARTALDGGTP